MKNLLLLVTLLAGVGLNSSARTTNNHNSPRLTGVFIENRGQIKDQNNKQRSDIQFELEADSRLSIFVGGAAIHYQFSHAEEVRTRRRNIEQMTPEVTGPLVYSMCRMDVELVGANRNARVSVSEPSASELHFYLPGCDGKTAHSYGRLVYSDVYPNIDWVLYVHNGELKHEFRVRAGGRVSDIRLRYGGADQLMLNSDGSLTATTEQGTITEQAPESYDAKGVLVSSAFVLKGNVLTYNVAASGPLTIDPTLSWATYYGGSGNDWGSGLTTDHSGNVYMSGNTTSASGIATSGTYHTTYYALDDAFLAKFSTAGGLIWATYYGSDSLDNANDVAVDASGNAYIAGYTAGISGIATVGSFQPTRPGGQYDAFLAKFNSSGALQWATYSGGNGDDRAQALSTDGAGNVYIEGMTTSTTGISTPGSFQPSYGGGFMNAYIARYNSAGLRQWATYYGAGYEGFLGDLAVDDSANVFIVTETAAGGLASPGAYHTSLAGINDALLVKFDSLGNRRWATYYGGSNAEHGWGIATDKWGAVYITGFTGSTSGIATPGAHQTIFNGYNDVYLAKFDGAGALQWGTYYGGSGGEFGDAIATDAYGYVYLTGVTESTTFISTPGSYQPTFAGYYDGFLAVFNSAGVRQWATYYGGSSDDESKSVATDGAGSVYITGFANSSTGIATSGSLHPTPAGGLEAFLAKFCVEPNPGTLSGPSAVCATRTITLTDIVTGGAWSVTNTHATVSGGIVTGVSAGTDTVLYIVANACGSDTAMAAVTINPLPDAGTIAGADSVCVGATITLTAGSTPGTWSSSSTGVATVSSGVVTGVAAGSVTISYVVTNVCGADTATKTIIVKALPSAGSITGAATVCVGATTTLANATTGGVWVSSNTAVGTVSGSGVVAGQSGGTTTISYTVTNSCGSATVTKLMTVVPLPNAGVIAGADTVCLGGSTITLTDAVGGGTWSAVNGLVTVTGGVVTAVAAGVDTVVYTIANVCGTARAVKAIMVSDCVNTVREIEPDPVISIVPNPAADVISITSDVALTEVVVSDMFGRRVMEKHYSRNRATIDVSALTRGVYVVRVNGSFVRKVVKK